MADFTIVKRQIITEYIKLYGSDRNGYTWDLAACIDVFRYYYWQYKRTFKQDHPHLKNETIRRIIEAFPYIEDDTMQNRAEDLEPGQYPALIDAYFKQDFDGCNYSIAHFMSGDIRLLRYYEELY